MYSPVRTAVLVVVWPGYLCCMCWWYDLDITAVCAGGMTWTSPVHVALVGSMTWISLLCWWYDLDISSPPCCVSWWYDLDIYAVCWWYDLDISSPPCCVGWWYDLDISAVCWLVVWPGYLCYVLVGGMTWISVLCVGWWYDLAWLTICLLLQIVAGTYCLFMAIAR